MDRVAELVKRLESLLRVRLAALPTPLEECPRLSDVVGGPQILVKRDDLTGVAFGGNKTRHLEYHLGWAVAEKADVVITCSGAQSNHCRQTAGAAAKLGMKAVLLLQGRRPKVLQGNTLVMKLLGADLRFYDVPAVACLEPFLFEVAEEYAVRGYKPHVINTAHGAPAGGLVAYTACVVELYDQLRRLGIQPQHVAVSSCGGTLAGLLVGIRYLGLAWNVFGVSPVAAPIGDVASASRRVARTAQEVSDILSLGLVFREEDVTVYDGYVGSGYGVVTPQCLEVIKMAATSGGLILDPVYTGKAMAAVIDLSRKGVLRRGETIVFIHTGGLPALFAYSDTFSRE